MKRIFYSTILVVAATLANWQKAAAQQYPLFTNYVVNAYAFNPAATGLAEKLDIRGIYRTQWLGVTGQPQTTVVAVNGKMGKLPFGVGGYLFKDVAGRLDRTGGNLMLSAIKKLGPNSTLSIGASGGVYQMRLQADPFVKDLADPIVDNAQKAVIIPDLSVGVYFKQENGLFAGISVPQLYKKKVFYDPTVQRINTTEIVRQYFGMVGYDIKTSDKLTIEPSALVKISPNVKPQLDFSIRGIFNKMFWVGGSFRTEDAVAAMIGIDKQRWYAVYSYDVTTSALRAASSGSHEITFGIRLSNKKCADEDGDGICDKDDECPKEPGDKENKGCPKKEEEPKEKKCPDRDKDGICDKDDKCPDVYGSKDNQGCPTNDRDGDGIRDDIDKCPDIPGSARNEGCPLSDRDKDGILDEIDPCPDEPGPLTNMGCPTGSDRDKDGTPDKDDPCPDVPGPKENRGCPFGGDRDGDGIPDDIDRCPNTAGPKDNGGCPIATQPEKDILTIAIRNLYFDTDKWNIRPSSYRDLNNVVKVLKEKKDWKLKISGHADLRGSLEHNVMLSRNRANSVRNYLISKGISPNLLEVEYHGEDNSTAPIVDKAALQLDRRVELEYKFD
jgi:type IX secretion system PorP/SprF family membrane protein